MLITTGLRSPLEAFPPTLMDFAFGFCATLMLLGIPGNLFTIIALARCKKVSLQIPIYNDRSEWKFTLNEVVVNCHVGVNYVLRPKTKNQKIKQELLFQIRNATAIFIISELKIEIRMK